MTRNTSSDPPLPMDVLGVVGLFMYSEKEIKSPPGEGKTGQAFPWPVLSANGDKKKGVQATGSRRRADKASLHPSGIHKPVKSMLL